MQSFYLPFSKCFLALKFGFLLNSILELGLGLFQFHFLIIPFEDFEFEIEIPLLLHLQLLFCHHFQKLPHRSDFQGALFSFRGKERILGRELLGRVFLQSR
uniref:Uncharacterized protein n=1 Tax=Salix viminalis TaxID=40686 RepID=A0A6N2KIQ4_SALVM